METILLSLILAIGLAVLYFQIKNRPKQEENVCEKFKDELNKIADNNNLWLLEDNSQAPGGVIEGGAYTATVGKAGVFSFNRHKTMQCGEGGVVLTNDKDVAKKWF